MADWNVKTLKKVKLNKPVLVEGMPGIGNVGKIAADLMLEQFKPVKIMTFFSYCLPNSVFVNEDNLVELPKIELYYKKRNNQDFLFLVGDVQPMKEEDSYKFTQTVLDAVNKHKCREIVTLGGIGLQEHPKKPKVFCTGNDKNFIKEFEKLGAINKLYGVVGPIMGISGLLLGLGKEKAIKAVSLLAETYGHPMHIGLREAKELLKILEKKYKLGINLKKLEKDINSFEHDLKHKTRRHQELLEQAGHDQSGVKDTNYIG